MNNRKRFSNQIESFSKRRKLEERKYVSYSNTKAAVKPVKETEYGEGVKDYIKDYERKIEEKNRELCRLQREIKRMRRIISNQNKINILMTHT